MRHEQRPRASCLKPHADYNPAMFKRVFLAAIVLAFACHKNPTAPGESATAHGRLFGVVTIGPNCPVATPDNPCPTPPSAFALRKVLIFNSDHSKQLFTVDIDAHGLYLMDLVPGTYVIDLKPVGIDRSADVPFTVAILANISTQHDISIDTGLR
jgi:hypothetical protein